MNHDNLECEHAEKKQKKMHQFYVNLRMKCEHAEKKQKNVSILCKSQDEIKRTIKKVITRERMVQEWTNHSQN